jgi:hypothetical protein
MERLFFNFFHVKNCSERKNEETPLWWAVENVASYHITISRFEILYWNLLRELINFFFFFSRFLQMEPITFDMKDAQGSNKHHLVSVFDKIRKIISNIKLKGILLLLDGLTFRNGISIHNWSKSSTTTIRSFPVFRSAESHFSSNTLGFLKISWYKHILKAPSL